MGSSNVPPSRPVDVPRPAYSLTLSSGVVFATSLSVQLIGLIGTIFLVKPLGIGSPIGGNPAGIALIGVAQLFLLIASSVNGVADLRLGSAYTYYLARGKSPLDNTATYLAIRLTTMSSAGLILFVAFPMVVGGSFSTYLVSFGIFLTLPISWSFATVYNQMFIGLGNSLRAQLPSLVEAVVRVPFLFYVSYHVQTVEGITIAYAIGAAASALFTLPAVLPRLTSVRLSELLHLYRYAWPLMGSLLLGYLVTNSVPLIVNGLGPFDLSVFLAANGWRVLVLSLPIAVTTPLFPYIAGLHQRREYETLRQATWQALRYSAMVLVPGVVALVTYRTNFLNIFQNALYAGPGSLPLAILVVGALPLAFSQIIQSSINAIGRQRLELFITSTQVAILGLLVGLFMPPFGVSHLFQRGDGLEVAAAITLVSSSSALVLNTYFMETLIRVHLRPRPMAAITLSAAGSFGALSLVNRTRFFPVSTWYELLVAVAIGFVVYFFILVGVGELTRGDVRRIGSSLGIPWRLREAVARLCWKERPPELGPIDLGRATGLRATELPDTFTGTRELPDIAPLPAREEERPNENGHDRP